MHLSPLLRRCGLAALPSVVPFLLPAQSPTRRDSLARADSIARLAAVTVVAAPAGRDRPASVTRVDAATIHLTPARTPYELLRQAAGLEVHEQGQGPGFASDAAVRGFSSDHATDLALWVDGVPINEPVNAHAEGYNDWSVLFPAGIESIDVVRGPASALFGNFALAGVVNVRTSERMTGTEASASGGSFGRADVMASTGFDRGAAGGGVIGARYARDGGFRPNADDDLVQGHARLVRDLRAGLTIDGGVELYAGRWHSPGFLSEDEFARGAYDIVSNASDGGFKRRAQERLSLRVVTSNFVWRTTAYATQGRWQLYLTIPPEGGRLEGSGSQTEEEDSRAGAGATSAITFPLRRGETTIGAESRWDRSGYDSWYTTSRTRDSAATMVTGRQRAGALFVQSHVDLSARWRVDAGLRYDLLATRSALAAESARAATHAVVSPKLGTLMRLTPSVGLYASLARGFRSANGVIEDPSLVPITAWAYETGVKLDAGDASASVALFRMDVSNEQTLNPVTLESTNGGASRRQGVETAWRVPITRAFILSGDWTLNDARYRQLVAAPEDGPGGPVVLDGQRVYNTARYVGTAALDIAPAAMAWRVRVSGNWVGPYSPFDEPGVVVGDYGLVHVGASLPAGRVELDAGIRNLFDRRYPELVAGHIVAPGVPRSFDLSVRTHI